MPDQPANDNRKPLVGVQEVAAEISFAARTAALTTASLRHRHRQLSHRQRQTMNLFLQNSIQTNRLERTLLSSELSLQCP